MPFLKIKRFLKSVTAEGLAISKTEVEVVEDINDAIVYPEDNKIESEAGTAINEAKVITETSLITEVK